MIVILGLVIIFAGFAGLILNGTGNLTFDWGKKRRLDGQFWVMVITGLLIQLINLVK